MGAYQEERQSKMERKKKGVSRHNPEKLNTAEGTEFSFLLSVQNVLENRLEKE